MNFIPPKISELIERLEKVQAEHGDIGIALDEESTGWTMEIGLDVYDLGDEKIAMITMCYTGDPVGIIGNPKEN